MKTLIKQKRTISNKENLILLCNSNNKLSKYNFTNKELAFIKKEQKNKSEIIELNQYERYVFLVSPKKEKNPNLHAEKCRLLGDKLTEKLNHVKSVLIIDIKKNQLEAIQIAEGMSLSNYTFNQHKTNPKPNKLNTIYLCKNSNKKHLEELQNIINAVYFTRNLVNEPFSHLTAINLANAAKNSGKKHGFKTTILDKKKIESLKMGEF